MIRNSERTKKTRLVSSINHLEHILGLETAWQINKPEDLPFTDVTLVTEDGGQVAAHRFILAAASMLMRDCLRQQPEHIQDSSVILLPDYSIEEVREWLSVIYGRPAYVDMDKLSSLMVECRCPLAPCIMKKQSQIMGVLDRRPILLSIRRHGELMQLEEPDYDALSVMEICEADFFSGDEEGDDASSQPVANDYEDAFGNESTAGSDGDFQDDEHSDKGDPDFDGRAIERVSLRRRSKEEQGRDNPSMECTICKRRLKKANLTKHMLTKHSQKGQSAGGSKTTGDTDPKVSSTGDDRQATRDLDSERAISEEHQNEDRIRKSEKSSNHQHDENKTSMKHRMTIKCSHCSKLVEKEKMADHLAAKHEKQCPHCEERFFLRHQLNRHISKFHKESIPLTKEICEKCGKLVKAGSFKKHLDSCGKPSKRTPYAPMACVIDPNNPTRCPKEGCSYTSRLKGHIRKHYRRNHERVMCTYCGQYCSYYILREHIAKMHKDDTRYHRFPCEHCPERFLYKSWLVDHVEKVHIRKLSYICEICGKGFFSKKLCGNHKTEFHNMCQVNPCSVCGTVFKSRKVLRSHMAKKHKAVLPHLRPLDPDPV